MAASVRLDLIKSFAALGAHRHYGVAAAELGISQPSLTKQIRRLEDLLGAPLFERSRQGTELTMFGRHFLKEVEPVLVMADHIWDRGLNAARGTLGQVAIGFTFSAVPIMSRALAGFQEKYPDVTLTFDDTASENQIARVLDHNLDVGFVRAPVNADLDYQIVASERLCFVYPTGWQKKIGSLDQASLQNIPFIALKTNSSPGLERYIREFLNSKGVRPKAIHHVNAALTLLSMVADGLGAAFLHESAVHGTKRPGGIVSIPIEEKGATWDVALIWRKNEQNPTVLKFLHEVQQVKG